MSNTIENAFDDICNAIMESEQKMCTDIGDFHHKFGMGYEGNPRQLERDMAGFRIEFMQEELDEYCTAWRDNDMPGQLDALVDLVYVALGTAHLQGFNFMEAWDRVHDANMQKMRVEKAEDSKRNSPYDIVKPEGWVAPDLTDLC